MGLGDGFGLGTGFGLGDGFGLGIGFGLGTGFGLGIGLCTRFAEGFDLSSSARERSTNAKEKRQAIARNQAGLSMDFSTWLISIGSKRFRLTSP